MASNKNNNTVYTRADGSVNCDNPRVVAALVDTVGMMLTRVFHDLKANPEMLDALSDDIKADLDCVLNTMRMIRNNIGVDTDWFNENQADIVPEIMRESQSKRESFKEGIAQALLGAARRDDDRFENGWRLQCHLDVGRAADRLTLLGEAARANHEHGAIRNRVEHEAAIRSGNHRVRVCAIGGLNRNRGSGDSAPARVLHDAGKAGRGHRQREE